MLRAIRFSSQLGFDIAPNLLDSISRMKERMKIISWERITQELIKILSTKTKHWILCTSRYRLLDIILPEFSIMQGVEIKIICHIRMFLSILPSNR